MKRKLLCIILMGLISFSFLFGCQGKTSDVGAPPVTMKTVTQNSQDDYITCTFQLPEGWIAGTTDPGNVIGVPEYALEKDLPTEEEQLPYKVMINMMSTAEREKQMYKDLFEGKTSTYDESVREENRQFHSQMEALTSSSIEDHNFEFQFQIYNGTYGKIAAVKTYNILPNGEKKLTVIRCYREDIPYYVHGFFDESVELSSGDIALWVADSLQVTEHIDEKKQQQNED